MHATLIFRQAVTIGLGLFLGTSALAQETASVSKAAPQLGTAAPAPPGLELNPPPGKGPKPRFGPVTGGFAVNTDAREEVRSFYNAIFPTSDNVAQDTTADASSCTPGHNSNAFQQAELRRINWFRAMAGMPATIALDPIDDYGSQQMAVMERLKS